MPAPPARPQPSREQSMTPHYQTFPTKPPTSRGKPPTSNLSAHTPDDRPRSSSRPHSSRSNRSNQETPLPKKQLAVLAIIALAEQTALNSISPYLPAMASTFPDVNQGQVGLYVGLIASSFALAQFSTNFFWGLLSDRIGRKPVVLLGTITTAACFVAFGFCKTLWQAILVQVIMGLGNGNQAVISTCLGEITDRSNQSKAFTYLPVIYGIGGITGPILGGLLSKEAGSAEYPFLAPNLLSAAILMLDAVIAMFFLQESLEHAQELPPLPKRVGSLFGQVWQFFSGSTSPTFTRPGAGDFEQEEEEDDDDDTENNSGIMPEAVQGLKAKDVLNRDTMLILATFFIFQISNISYNSLYPIFAQAAPPTGRDLNPEEIGISLGFAGAVTILFQVSLFGRLRDKIGNKGTYKIGLGLFVLAYLFMPFVAYKKEEVGEPHLGVGKGALWFELGVVLIVKTLGTVMSLTSALLLITNSAPNHGVLGTLNGLAQTLSAAGRAIGPLVSGALFSASTHIRPKGEALAFGIFGGISLIGFLLSFGIHGNKLEAGEGDEEEGSSEDDDDDEEDEEDEEASERQADESTPLNGKKR